MDPRAPAVVAVVVTTGPGPGLEATLASIVDQDYSEMSVLVVANGETENVAARVAAIAPNAFVRALEENHGFGAACNEAALMVEGSAFFLFCHDDVRLDSDAVQRLVESAFRTNAGVVTPKVVAYDDPLVLLHVGQTCDRFGVVQERVELGEIDHGQQDLERDVFVAPGGVTLVRSDLFAALRGFDPLIPVLGEDLDLCWRAQVAGARIVVAPSARVAHRESIARGERAVTAAGTRRASRQDLQRRHQLLVVATGWGVPMTALTLGMLAVMDTMEFCLALAGRDTDRAGAILGSWRWLFHHRRRIRERRRLRHETHVLSDADLHRLQIGGAGRLERFFVLLLREGLDRARGILPGPDEASLDEGEDAGVGFGAAFAESEEFDDIPESEGLDRGHPSRVLSSFRSQSLVVTIVVVLWLFGSRNLVAMHLPLIGRLAPLDSWWSNWRHFFASWSPDGVGTGVPGLPGYGVIGLAGTFVIGRMGILPRLVLIGAVPVGAIGVARLLRGHVSNRARVVACLAYVALPVGLNMIGQGRIDVLVDVAFLPFIARRLFELLAVPGFKGAPYREGVSFGQRGWRATRSGQRMAAVMLIALVTAMAPATLIVVALIVIGVVVARLFEPDGVASRPGRLLAQVVVGVALFLLPLTIDVALAGRRALGVFGLAGGPWSAPSFWQLVRGADGSFGSTWTGFILPAAAVVAVVICRGERRALAGKVLAVATVTLVITTLDARHWMGPFAPDIDVLLTLYALMLALLIGLGVSALELDLRQAGFGWRQAGAGLLVLALVIAVFPFLAIFGSGRYDLPTSSVAESLSALAPTSAGGYRVLWLGDPAVVPVAGWIVAAGLEVATSTNGLPGGSTLFAPPGPGTAATLLHAVSLALQGRTVHLGELLAPAGISSIVVMNAAAPEITGVQSVPSHAVPDSLVAALIRQTDLSLELETGSVTVFSNSLFHGLVAQSTPAGAWTPVLGGGFAPGTLATGGQVQAGFAPASDFRLTVNSEAAPRTTTDSWVPTFQVVEPQGTGGVTGELSLAVVPLNALIAALTLGFWIVVWLGFGWRQRLEWLVARRRPVNARHARPRE